MWQRDRKTIIIRCILLALSLVLLAGLAFAVKTIRGREEAQDSQLLELYNRQQAQQQKDRQASLEEVLNAYNQDVAAVEKYLPGIVCWGDVLTGGTAGGVSYPAELQTLIDTGLCQLYDFRSTVKNANDFNNRLKWEDYVIEIPVVNMGTGRENVDTVLGRNGALPYITATKLEIPAEGESNPITLKSSYGVTVNPLTQADLGVNDVTIAGISGKLSTVPNFSVTSPRYVFTRNEPGEAISLEAGETVTTASSTLYKNYFAVVFVGSFGGYKNPNELVEKINALLSQQDDPSRYLIIGTYYLGTAASGRLLSAAQAAKTETVLSQAYGEHYINLRKYLANECMNELLLKPTTEDNDSMLQGIVPPSLLSKENGLELIPGAYKSLGRLVYDKLVNLGYLDEIVEELEIKDFGKEITDEQK